MAKRGFDILFSAFALLLVAPLMAAVATGIGLSSPGPILFRARRVGLKGKPIVMYKFRTMHVAREDGEARITAAEDPRVYSFGSLLRRLKLDELPQFYNVLIGDLSVVGPRPEDPGIVAEHYSPRDIETLSVKPGLVSPGSLFNYTHGDIFLRDDPQTERRYLSELLPIKLSLERFYVRRAGMAYDLLLIFRTISIIFQRLLGRERFPLPPEVQALDAGLEAKLETFIVNRA